MSRPVIRHADTKDAERTQRVDSLGSSTRKCQPQTDSTILSISQWLLAQDKGNGLDRILALVESESKANLETHAWITLASKDQLVEQWNDLEARKSKGETMPLFGVPCAIKDNMDVVGFPTTAACPAFAKFRSGAVTQDAVVVTKLREAGAVVIGKTNMDQFASGLVGNRTHYGAVTSACDPTRVAGGSSSGSAVVVSRGVVPFALGSDTAGSIRVPAGFNNLVGVKPTRGALSTRGVLPACRTLDCVSVLAATLQDANIVLSIVSGFDVEDAHSRLRPPKIVPQPQLGFGTADIALKPHLAVCSQPKWFGQDEHRSAYEASLARAKQLGWILEPIDFTDLFELSEMLYGGAWVAERYHAIRGFIDQASPSDMNAIVRDIFLKSKNLTAVDAFESEYKRQELVRKISIACSRFDGILVPTSPTFPTSKEVEQDPTGENFKLGIYTNFVNLLDWTAIAVPAGFRTDGVPFGITLISSAWQEKKLFQLAETWLKAGQRELGATGVLSQKGDDILQ